MADQFAVTVSTPYLLNAPRVQPPPTSWKTQPPAQRGWAAPTTTGSGMGGLMSWGPVVFQVWPLNYHEMQHETETDWARKQIVGAAIYREWVGENDEIRTIHGRI